MLSQVRGGGFIFLLLRLRILTLTTLPALAPTGLLTSLPTRFRVYNWLSSGTIAYRLERFDAALAEWASSPILGLERIHLANVISIRRRTMLLIIPLVVLFLRLMLLGWLDY